MPNDKVEVDIRPWSDADLELLERLLGDPAMTEHLGGPEPRERIRERHRRFCGMGHQPGSDAMFAIVVGTERVGVGSIGYWQKRWNDQHVWETGWSVLPEFQGQGIATRAVARIVERLRGAEKHRWLHAFPSVDNAASNAICRKVGFRLVGQFDFEYPPGHPVRCNDWRLDLLATVMNHETFVRRTKGALDARSAGRPDDAVAELRALLLDLESAVESGVNEWHRQQALGILIDALDAAGRREECRAAWEALIGMTRDASTYWEKALSSARVDYARWSERG